MCYQSWQQMAPVSATRYTKIIFFFLMLLFFPLIPWPWKDYQLDNAFVPLHRIGIHTVSSRAWHFAGAVGSQIKSLICFYSGGYPLNFWSPGRLLDYTSNTRQCSKLALEMLSVSQMPHAIVWIIQVTLFYLHFHAWQSSATCVSEKGNFEGEKLAVLVNR